MKNKILAQFSHTIPYIKELRTLASSATTSILMQQLDYWFSKYPNGFYKFLEPCDHVAYVNGKSWAEEIGFSDREFRTAFNHIGIRYHSKGDYGNAGEDKFQGKFFCSYHDKQRGTTHYFRNHDLLDEALKILEQSGMKSNVPQPDPLALIALPETPRSDQNNCPGASQDTPDKPHPAGFSSVTAHSSVTEPTDEQSCNYALRSYVTTHPAVTHHKEINKQINEKIKKTAAVKVPSQMKEKIMSTNASESAAAVSFAMTDTHPSGSLICDSLSAHQRALIQETAKIFHDKFPQVNLEELVQAMCFFLLDPKSFTQAGRDFHKKLNTLKKCIREGRWSLPAGLLEEKELAIQKTLRSLQQQLQERQGEYQHLHYLISSAHYQQDSSTVEQLRKQIITCRDAIDQLKKTFNDCVLHGDVMHKNAVPIQSTEGFHHSDITTKQENNHVTS